MNMFYVYGNIAIDRLRELGYDVKEETRDNYGSISKGNSIAYTEDDGEGYITAICQWRGLGVADIIVDLYTNFPTFEIIDEGGFGVEIFYLRDDDTVEHINKTFLAAFNECRENFAQPRITMEEMLRKDAR